jgi:hypothetical protein
MINTIRNLIGDAVLTKYGFFTFVVALSLILAIFSSFAISGAKTGYSYLVDSFDTKQYIIITNENKEYTVIRGEDVALNICVENLTNSVIDLDVVYTVTNGFDNHPNPDIRKAYITEKLGKDNKSISMKKEGYCGPVFAFTGDQTKYWEVGTVTTRLHYTYKYRVVERTNDVFFTVKVV